MSQAISALQEATDEVDAAAAERLGVNRTDLRCINVLFVRGPLAANQLAAATKITPGALTTAADRLEQAGYLVRQRLPHDRRRVFLTLTERATSAIEEIWGPLVREAMTSLARYDADQLATILDFAERAAELQRRHAGRIQMGRSLGHR
ncbi:MAG TPA: MarR family transcriptional regulator [Micromonosporaceae bacterium]